MTLTPQARKIIKWVGIPTLYLLALAMFAYAAFPYDRLKDRLVMGFNASQSGPDSNRIEIDDLSWSWRFPGFSASGIRIIGPEPKGGKIPKPALPKPAASATGGASNADDDSEEEDAAKKVQRDGVIEIGDLHARIAPLSLLFGTKAISFGGDAFGGELDGEVVLASEETRFELELEDIDAGGLPGVKSMVGLPLAGQLNGMISLLLPEGKSSKAEGEIELVIENLEVGDGEAKILNAIALPKVEAGTLKLTATITAGRMKIKEFTCEGQDLELDADGQLRLRDALMQSVADMTVSFKFSDKYKTKNDITKGLFGEPGSSVPGLFDVNPQVKRALSPDGFYTWKATGALSKLHFNPAAGQRDRTGAADKKSKSKFASNADKTTSTRSKPQRAAPPPRPTPAPRQATPPAPAAPPPATPTPVRPATPSRAATGPPPRTPPVPAPVVEEAEEEQEEQPEQAAAEEEVAEEEAAEEEEAADEGEESEEGSDTDGDEDEDNEGEGGQSGEGGHSGDDHEEEEEEEE